MPFTVTHALAVLPIAHRSHRLPIVALLIGAMIPDWGLFIPIGPHYSSMHTWPGLLTACVPMGLLMYALYRLLYRRALVELAPLQIQQRLSAMKQASQPLSLQQCLLAALAVALGAATHLVWDAFTHSGRWGVELLPVLSSVVTQAGSLEVKGYQLLQHGSSVVGLPLLVYVGWRWLMIQARDHSAQALLSLRARCALLLVLLGVPLLIAGGKALAQLDSMVVAQQIDDVLVYFVTRLGLLCFVLFNAYALSLRILNRRQSRSDGKLAHVG